MSVFFTAAVIRFHHVFDKFSLFENSALPLRCLVLSYGLNFCLCLFRMRRARAAPAADAAFENEIGDDQSVQDEIPPAPRRRGRDRGRGRVRAAQLSSLIIKHLSLRFRQWIRELLLQAWKVLTRAWLL